MSTLHTGNFIKCNSCSLKDFCLPMMLSTSDIDLLDSIIQRKQSISKGTQLFSIGDNFSHIYAIRSGYLKSYMISESGEEQITGFHLPGEIVGLDGINTGFHKGFAEALVSSQVCAIPYDKLDKLNSTVDGLRQQLLKIMSREITHDHELLLMLNQKNADEKIANFLLNLSSRDATGKGLNIEFFLPMTRTDIANYLGLALETVSRIISKLIKQEIISVTHKKVTIKQINKLTEIAGMSYHFNIPDTDEPKSAGA